MKRIYVLVPAIVFVLVLTGCGLGLGLSSWPTESTPTQGPFKCGGPSSIIQVTSGTGSLPGSVVLQNFPINKAGTRQINALSSTGGAATVIDLTCGDVGLKCKLANFDSVKICGGSGVWKLTTTQITITEKSAPSD